MKYLGNLRDRLRTRLLDLFVKLLSINKYSDPIFQKVPSSVISIPI